MNSVTVITATVGNPLLFECIASVARQLKLVPDVRHLIIVDGPEHTHKLKSIVDEIRRLDISTSHIDFVYLPYSIGKDRWNGHRIYAAGAFMVDSKFIIYLDDDNTLTPTHIHNCLDTINQGNDWCYSFRNIVDKDQKFICKDECESLGKWASVLDPKDFFIDVNCYFIPTKLAVHLGPAWYRKFREPGMPEVDRVLSHVLMNNGLKFDCTYKHTVNYTAGNTPNSVQLDFFLNGNKSMRKKYPDGLPWLVRELPFN